MTLLIPLPESLRVVSSDASTAGSTGSSFGADETPTMAGRASRSFNRKPRACSITTMPAGCPTVGTCSSASCRAGSNGWPRALKLVTPCRSSACSSVARTSRTPLPSGSSPGSAESARSRPSTTGKRSLRSFSFP